MLKNAIYEGLHWSSCGCPVRELPPDLPATLPFDLVPENQQQIPDWLMQHFRVLAFKVCETQKLPLINSSSPLKLLVDPKAKPVVVHRASPVPVHWMAKVKADLDRDLARGVLEKVEGAGEHTSHVAVQDACGAQEGWVVQKVCGSLALELGYFPSDSPHGKPICPGLQDPHRHLEVYSGHLEWLPLGAAGQGVQGAYQVPDALGEIPLLGEPRGAAHKWRCVHHEV